MNTYLADVNFIFALLVDEHTHFERANGWLFDIRQRGAIGVCRIVQMGVLRLLTNKLAMSGNILTAEDAWKCVQILLSDERFEFVAEPEGLADSWQKLSLSIPKGSSFDTDAYLAAFAISGRLSLLTLDGGMKRFPGLQITTPR